MIRILIGAVIAALVLVPLTFLFAHKGDTPPPNSVIVNFTPYPEKLQDRLPAPTAKAPAVAKVKPKAKAPTVVTTAPAPPKVAPTWNRVVIIDGRKCYQPMGGGPITARYCE